MRRGTLTMRLRLRSRSGLSTPSQGGKGPRWRSYAPLLAVALVVACSNGSGDQVTRPVAVGMTSKMAPYYSDGQITLYQAQTPMVGTTARPLSLEQIAAKRRSCQEWGQIFRDLKTQGLVHEKTLGQVVARYLRTTDAAPSVVSNDGGGGYATGVANGVGKGGK